MRRFSSWRSFQQVVVLILMKGTAPKGNLFDRFVSLVSSIFQPFLGPFGCSRDYQRNSRCHGSMWPVSCNKPYVCHLECSRRWFLQFLPILITLTSARRFKVSWVYSYCDCSGTCLSWYCYDGDCSSESWSGHVLGAIHCTSAGGYLDCNAF